jgi:hypothetical protein
MERRAAPIVARMNKVMSVVSLILVFKSEIVFVGLSSVSLEFGWWKSVWVCSMKKKG